MHALYRKHFNACDQFNKAALQPGTLTDVWHTRSGWHRLFAATVSFIETNAFLAFNACNRSRVKMTKAQWYRGLSEALINNPWSGPVARGLGPSFDSVGHSMGPRTNKQARCDLCSNKTYFKCSCGRALCALTRKKAGTPQRDCYGEHLKGVFEADASQLGTRPVKRGRRPSA